MQKSKYNTEKTAYRTNADRDLAEAQRKTRADSKKNAYTTHEISEYNSATDWNVTKGKTRVRVRK